MGDRRRLYIDEIAETTDGWSRWVTPVQQGYRMACCDCGLVHEMDFRIDDEWVEFRIRRHNRATAAIRRYRGRAPR